MQPKIHSVLITGATGFLGHHLSAYLKEKKRKIYPLNLRKQWEDQAPEHYDCIIHLAGKAHDLKSLTSADQFYKTNVTLTEDAFRHFLNSNAILFIHLSSIAAIEEEHSEVELTEDTPPNPRSPYGKSKLEAENALLKTPLPDGKKLIILRPAMIHGPGDKGNITLLYRLINKGIPYPFASFSNKRTFLSIDNFCFVIDKILENKIPSGIYNVVDDESLSTLEIIGIISQSTGRLIHKVYLPKRMVFVLGKIGDLLKLPINSNRIAKLTTDLPVSNKS
ncbi:NAD-dependent epimerase/dehydratase family protein [Bdellovibrio bacteriovorus]|uniref:NAD-dependent epimerase/dehydratase family protein n=1 Tax=Bdellovibrio bacteriovorus TaxID=959 RepID=UPI0035A5C917